MHTFIANGTFEVGKPFQVSGPEAHHCIKVTRHQIGDSIRLIDLQGHWAIGQINSIISNNAFQFLTTEIGIEHIVAPIHLYLVPPKTKERLDFIIEKAVEIGVTSIFITKSERAERKQVNLEKIKDQMIAALKQCGGSLLPNIEEISFVNALKNPTAKSSRLFAHCNNALPRIPIEKSITNNEVSIYLGPEGDFSNQEIELAIQQQWTPITFGDRILRSETACIYALSVIKSKLLYK